MGSAEKSRGFSFSMIAFNFEGGITPDVLKLDIGYGLLIEPNMLVGIVEITSSLSCFLGDALWLKELLIDSFAMLLLASFDTSFHPFFFLFFLLMLLESSGTTILRKSMSLA